MIEEITFKFGTELKPTQHNWKSQLYIILWQVREREKEEDAFEVNE